MFVKILPFLLYIRGRFIENNLYQNNIKEIKKKTIYKTTKNPEGKWNGN